MGVCFFGGEVVVVAYFSVCVCVCVCVCVISLFVDGGSGGGPT